MAVNPVLIAKAIDAARDRKVQLLIGGIIVAVFLLFGALFSLAGGILSALYAAINPSVTGRLEDDLHWQVIQEIKAELAITNDLNVSTLKVIDLEHHHDFLKERSEIREYIKAYFVVEYEEKLEISPGEDTENALQAVLAEHPDAEVEVLEDGTVIVTVTLYRFKTPDEIMTMLPGEPFHFDAETLEAIRELVYTPPTTEELHYTGNFPMPCSGYITSPYGERIDPITGESSWHKGIDIVPAHQSMALVPYSFIL